MNLIKNHEARYIRKNCLDDYLFKMSEDYYIKAYNDLDKGKFGVVVGRYGHNDNSYLIEGNDAAGEWR